ncbi:uncharacterized protein [Montipora foliosa]|uniref:uncharacterized protein isoform X2 n=1 Tax=Montipora foliosa TaxID=591990 RepID=UPI0035F1662F
MRRFHNMEFTETGAVTQRVIKGHQNPQNNSGLCQSSLTVKPRILADLTTSSCLPSDSRGVKSVPNEMGQCCGCWCQTLEQRVKETFPEESKIIDKEILWANLQYRRSRGCCQLNGNGAFVLTSEVVWFSLMCLDETITIPLRNILTVEAKNNVLVFDFVDGVSGIEDQVVIAIREPRRWLRLINEAIPNARQ